MRSKSLFYAVPAMLMLTSCAPKHYQLVSVERSRIIVDSRYDQQPDPQVTAFFAPYKHVNDSVMAPLMGRVAHNMHAQRPESDLSNLVSDIMIWAAKDYNESPVLGIYNMGGIRADLIKGDVTYEDILSIAPFENKICFTTLNGEQLMKLFRQIVRLLPGSCSIKILPSKHEQQADGCHQSDIRERCRRDRLKHIRGAFFCKGKPFHKMFFHFSWIIKHWLI